MGILCTLRLLYQIKSQLCKYQLYACTVLVLLIQSLEFLEGMHIALHPSAQSFRLTSIGVHRNILTTIFNKVFYVSSDASW